MSYTYDGKFEGNILVAGRTGCGKTGFVQKLAVNKFFGELLKTEWVSYAKLDKQREAEIQSCFDCKTDFYYPRNKGKRTRRNRLIVMDDVLGLADTSSKFASFLTVARKYKYHCLYIFYKIHPEKSIWKTILSQTNILNIFPASVPLNTVKRLLEGNCVRRTTRYIPVNSLGITKLFIQLANSENEKTCLTIDCTSFNPNGPGRYRTEAADPDKHTCYFNRADEDSLFNIFISKRIKKSQINFYLKLKVLIKLRWTTKLTVPLQS